ncbi:ELM2 domain protein [Raphanus sativus]|nr:ELM2 domain protein [Raphanus sativus]
MKRRPREQRKWRVTEPFVIGIRVGKEFQADVADWSGPTMSDTSFVDEPLEIDQSKYMHDLKNGFFPFSYLSGCCKPPTACGYNFVNPTLWLKPTNMGWLQMQIVTYGITIKASFCYNCNSCKAGLLGNLRKYWRKANLILIITVVILIWVYVIACSAFRNAQTEDRFRK